jgi:hypothetical protein
MLPHCCILESKSLCRAWLLQHNVLLEMIRKSFDLALELWNKLIKTKHEFGTSNKCMRHELHQNHCGKKLQL